MTLPRMVKFKPEHISKLILDHRAGSYKQVSKTGPSCTLKINDTPMACMGFDYLPGGAVLAWIAYSMNAKEHPGVAWAVREILFDALNIVKEIVIYVREDWNEARRFAEWLGFKKTGDFIETNGIKYFMYVGHKYG